MTPQTAAAVGYCETGWQVLPCWWPTAIGACACPTGPDCSSAGKHPIHHLTPHGKNDATTNPDTAATWWTEYPHANIGCVVPEGAFVVDVDPKAGGDIHRLERRATLPDTLTCISGRNDGGCHLYYRLDTWLVEISHTWDRALVDIGCDLRWQQKHYLLMPPSIHAATLEPYRWQEPIRDITPASRGLLDLIRRPSRPPRAHPQQGTGELPSERVADVTSWRDLLARHGWQVAYSRGDADYLSRPGKQHGISASLGHCTTDTGAPLLHVFTSSSPPLEAERTYSLWAAYALLDHRGDFKAAARTVREHTGGAT